jgi:hypothetical protein
MSAVLNGSFRHQRAMTAPGGVWLGLACRVSARVNGGAPPLANVTALDRGYCPRKEGWVK